ncbi:O-antigen ligase family protein [Ureibacillus sp. MALMAid1270]|uniref:O-antigen ligase family protein n=1 Tax=Ureibacillus sp. MALMAid1270 TaxID=3411629 RepID=UPI003BA707A7
MYENYKWEYTMFYLLWPIIIFPKQLQIVFIGIILCFLLRQGKIIFDGLSYFFIFYLVIYIISIFYNLFLHSYEFDRILATFNTLSIWIIAMFYYLLYKSYQLDLQELVKIGFVNYCILIGHWMISHIFHYLLGVSEFSIFGHYLSNIEWFSGVPVLRFVGFMDYANLVIMFFMFFYPLFCMYALRLNRRWFGWFLIVLGIFPVYSTYSRSGYFIILLGISLFIFHQFIKNSSIVTRGFLYCIVATLLVISIFYTNLVDNLELIFSDVYNAREGSNDTRSYLMEESMKVTFEKSPVIGMGIKTDSKLGYPLGSHSTFLGFFYKTGMVGFIVCTVMFLFISFKLLLLKMKGISNLMKYFIAVLPVMFLFEDLDGSNWLIVFYFILLAVLFGRDANAHSDRLAKDG